MSAPPGKGNPQPTPSTSKANPQQGPSQGGSGWNAALKNVGGNQRPPNQNKPPDLFTRIFGTALFARKWQKAMTEDRQAKIMEMFTVPRNDPYDVYKPNSELETQVLIETPERQPLNENKAQLLHDISSFYDYGTQLDVIDAPWPSIPISHDSKEQIDRLPTWLRFIVLAKYGLIHAKFQHRTHKFLKILADHIDRKRISVADIFDADLNLEGDDGVDKEIEKTFVMDDRDVVRYKPTKPRPADEDRPSLVLEEPARKVSARDVVHKIKEARSKWMIPKTVEQDWAPATIHRTAITMRRAFLTQPSPTEIAMVEEDERIAKNLKAGAAAFGEEDEALSGVSIAPKDSTWTETIIEAPGFKEDVERIVEEDLRRQPIGLSRKEREEEKVLLSEIRRRNRRSGKSSRMVKPELKEDDGPQLSEKKQRQMDFDQYAPHRVYDNIWVKNCPQESIKQARRFLHHHRCDECFHAYCVSLVASAFFKNFIMFVIILNALLLALDTRENREDYVFAVTLDVLDNFCLSVYLVEFIVKVYAHPNTYWQSGFNIFDFVILVVSLGKAIIDWTSDGLDVSYFKILVIFRALRILRSVSMSVQFQVLIMALLKTMKTYVVGILIFLVLLMYIAAILAFYLFGSKPGLEDPWGNILLGMLRLVAFVTMDAWTDSSDEMAAAGLEHGGRLFCLIGVIIGNFIICTVVTGIIFMQISEATESYRAIERDAKEEGINVKKEIVFRRQKLDMRQLLAKQKTPIHADFYFLGGQFAKLLRHDDLVDMNSVQFSPLWIDAFYKSVHRTNHTSNILMNLHRQMADSLLDLHKKRAEGRYGVTPIRRSRYNRAMKLKSKLALIRQEFYADSPTSFKIDNEKKLRIRIPRKGEDVETQDEKTKDKE